ncbi:MAG: hypothetical protein ACO1PI_15575 [Bacteroidota bacterium]
MKRLLSFKTAVTATVIILLLVTLFNLFVLLGVAPYTIVWGGRLESREQMVVFELVSILINLFCLIIVLVKARGFLPRLGKTADIVTWLLPVMYFFGILGNVASTSAIERALFVPVTVVLFVLTLRIALEKEHSK